MPLADCYTLNLVTSPDAWTIIMEEIITQMFEAVDSDSVIQGCCSVPASSEVF